MKKYISSAMKPDVLSREQKQEIADGIFKIVNTYFNNTGHGDPSPRVTYSEYDIKEYTFRINSRSYSRDVDYTTIVDGEYATFELNQFKAEVRSYLREEGFTKVSFKFDTFKQKEDQNTGYYRPEAPVYTYKRFVAIYFAQ